MRILLLLVIFGPLYFVSLGSAGVIDYDEALYAEVSRDMLERQEYVLPRYNGEPFNHKPPMLFWSQVAGYRLFGVGAFGARAGTALAGVLALLALYGFARRPLGPDRAFLTAFVLGTSLQFVALSRVALTDMQLTACFVVCLGSLYRAVEDSEQRGRGLSWFLLACLFSGLAMLSKGLIGLVLPAGALFFYLLSIKKLRLLLRPSWMVPGMILLAGVGFSWYLLIALTHPGGVDFMRELFLKQHVGRFTSSMDGHGGPFFYFVPVVLLGMMPWSPFLVLGTTRRAFRQPTEEGTRFLRLFTVFSLLTFVFFSIAATKLPNYITPALPGFALLIACFLSRHEEGESLTGVGARIAIGISVGLFLLFAVVLFALPFILSRATDILGEAAEKAPGLSHPMELGPWPYVAGILLLAGGALALRAYRQGRVPAMSRRLGATSIVLSATLLLFLLPRYDAHFNRPLREIARQAATLVPESEKVVLLGLRRRPSVIYYGGRGTEFLNTRHDLAVRAVLHGERERIGISTRYYLTKVNAPEGVEIIAENVGYVLFRTIPGNLSPTPKED